MNNDFQKKLQQYEADPPPAVWGRIADALDKGQSSFPERLFHYGEAPPADTWSKIEERLNGLETPTNAVVLPARRWGRYAAAAAVLAAVLLTTYFFTQQNTPAGIVQLPSLPSPDRSATPLSSPPFTARNTRGKPAEEPIAMAALSTYRSATARRQVAVIKPLLLSGAVALNNSFIPRRASKDVALGAAAADGYMVYSDENGKALRLPKKVVTLVACNTDDDPCRERLRQLQNQMVTGGMATDFTGLLDLLRQLQQKP